MPYTYETKYKLLDRVVWEYTGQVGIICEIHLTEITDSPGSYFVSYEIFLDGYETGDPDGLHVIAETGLKPGWCRIVNPDYVLR